jgi:type IV secretory pathway VirB4 component
MTLVVSPHRATTRNLASCYLLQADRPLDDGPVLGLDARSGGLFCFDPFAAYAAGLITNPNLLVLGEVGSGKSTVAKLICWTQRALLGRSVAILDPKGEYLPLAQLLGLPTVRLSPGGRTRINPLELSFSPGILNEHQRRRVDVLGALGESGLGRPLRPEERAALDATVGELTGAPLLGTVVDALLTPSTSVAATLRTSTGELASAIRDLALALRRLVAGDLAGMFDGPSTVHLDATSPGVHVDLSPVYTNPAVLAPTMVAAGSWLTAALAAPGRQSMLVLDETWQVLADPGIGRWLRATMKLARALGASVVLVTHSLADFRAVGDERSEAARLAASLVADTASRALLAHSDAALAETASVLELAKAESELLPNLRRGIALWHVGEHARLVRHLVPRPLLDALDTDAEMLGRRSASPLGSQL